MSLILAFGSIAALLSGHLWLAAGIGFLVAMSK